MILAISPGGSGFTFLCWTICFLRGDVSYQTLNNIESPMIWDPLQDKVAHKFRKDHIECVDDYHKLFAANNRSVIYFVPRHQKDFEFINQFGCKKILFDCQNYDKEFFARMYNTVPNCDYSPLLESLSKKYNIDIIKQVLLESNHFFTKYYHVLEPSDEYYIINFEQMFHTLDTTILDIFKFLQLNIDQNRFNHWQDIYTIYKEKNLNHLTEFLSKSVTVDSSVKIKILKEILTWRNGSFQLT
jgi:hypothetical protein